MTVLVFGASSHVGRVLSAREDVVALARTEADLTDPQRCARIIETARIDAVINAASFSDVDGAESAQATAQIVNARAPAAMARAAARLDIPFIHISSNHVFSGDGSAPWSSDAETAPLQTYGRTCAAGEVAIREMGGVHAILRSSWIYGDGRKGFVNSMLRAGRARPSVAVVDDLFAAPTPADALAELAYRAARVLRDHPDRTGTYHFAGIEDISLADFARAIFEAADLGAAIRTMASKDLPTLARRPANGRLDCSGTEQAFGLPQPNWSAHLSGVVRSNQSQFRAA